MATQLREVGTKAVRRTENLYGGYRGKEMPLGGYAVLMAVYGAALTGFILTKGRKEKSLPERPSPADIALLGMATHKLSRIITRDVVTATVRAPFTTYEESAGDGEVSEKARGTGVQQAIGQLVTCPYCMGAWVATAFTYGLALRPRLTRFIASIFATEAVADGLQLLYDAGKKLDE